MKTKVRVTLRGEEMVEMEIEHKEDESPTDLTKADCIRARNLAGVDSSWDVDDVEVVK